MFQPFQPFHKTIWLLPTLLLVAVSVEGQQPKKVGRVGLLISASTAVAEPYVEAFRQAMRELGYIEGKDYVLEIRGGGAEPGRVADLAAELVALKVDVIVAVTGPALRAAMKATSTVPIVMRTGTDPVEAGYISGLARPGGNITGVTSLNTKLIGKHLELLAEVVPGVKRVAVLVPQTDPAGFVDRAEHKEMVAAAPVLGVKLQAVSARDPDTIDSAFRAMTKEHAQALVVPAQPRYLEHGARILKHAAKNRLPAIYFQSVFFENGGPYVLRHKQCRRNAPCSSLCR